ncbi:AraC-like DNA-binding protein [Trinickia symbiotica]|uniref:AraC family transcriptional regulator n=1 Tax=Trinickia symbiotica TaxID=863227 RepID=A0A2N7X6T3_9BURK|nr:AraC family transcriptional regulator [Trinickia symbiotica]PMS37262.1 AraC family transcriptional regulator [Trinickia symbiotica]PPK42659.1 AraC-like DNA-binding protein [Trinickia symbiotica]
MSRQAIRAPSVTLRCFEEASAADEHDFHQVVLGLDGAMEMAVDGVAQRIDKRYAWLIPAGSRHEYAGIGENRQVVLDLSPASLAIPERLFARPLVVTLDDAFARLVMDVATGGAPMAKPASTLGASHARQFAWDTATRLAAALATAIGIEPPAVGLDFPRIDKWLRTNLSEPLRVPDLAAHCGFGTRRFHQLFEEAFGTTPHRYLQRLRLDTALALLRDPRNTLTDVALAVGFGDQSAFTHAFTRRFGLAPGQWRAMRAH